MTTVDLKSLSSQQLADLFNSVDTILCDNDGVLSHFGVLLPGVLNCINKFRDAGKCVKVVTNNTAFGRDLMSAAFKKQGLQCDRNDFITPTCALTNYLKEIDFKGKVWLMGFEPMEAEFKEQGIALADSENPKCIAVSEAKSYMFNFDPEIRAIVLDISLNATIGCIAKAAEYLKHDPSILLLFGSVDASLPVGNNQAIMGPKSFQNIVVDASKKAAIVFGKPSPYFGKYLTETLHCEPSRTLFIGDSLESDISFAKNMGFKQLLVLTGNTKLCDLPTCLDVYRPDYYISGLEELDVLLTKDLLQQQL